MTRWCFSIGKRSRPSSTPLVPFVLPFLSLSPLPRPPLDFSSTKTVIVRSMCYLDRRGWQCRVLRAKEKSASCASQRETSRDSCKSLERLECKNVSGWFDRIAVCFSTHRRLSRDAFLIQSAWNASYLVGASRDVRVRRLCAWISIVVRSRHQEKRLPTLSARETRVLEFVLHDVPRGSREPCRRKPG